MISNWNADYEALRRELVALIEESDTRDMSEYWGLIRRDGYPVASAVVHNAARCTTLARTARSVAADERDAQLVRAAERIAEIAEELNRIA
ncbi:hypothetical protein [Nocardia pseudovaccinii]|uniref:hypothetical protein n=1 Tax=Nocardia pseudovaccinii TaxID=189540 RepID=UPI0007A3BCA4|nr:hypothetical protein [Nocardia pseudovaccinii]